MFGHTSDLRMLQKQNLYVCSQNVLSIHFVRVKTSEEQDLTLFPDLCPHRCPITTQAVTLVLETTPNVTLLPRLPQSTANGLENYGPLVPLEAVLAGSTVDLNLLDDQQSAAATVLSVAAVDC